MCIRLKLLFLLLLIGEVALAQQSDTAALRNAKEGILQLHRDWNKARLAYDRKGLEAVFAPDYIWVHGMGYMDDRTAAINDQLATDSIRALPLPNLDGLELHGNLAIHRKLSQLPTGQASYNNNTYEKRNGSWLMVHSQTTFFHEVLPMIKLSPADLKIYAGVYEKNGQRLTIKASDTALHLRASRIPERVLRPTAENEFSDKLGSPYRFSKTADGKIEILTVVYASNPPAVWRKVE